MVRQTKAKLTETEKVQSVPVETPVVASALKEKKVKASKAPKEESVGSVPVVSEMNAVVEEPVVDGEVPVADQSVEFVARLQQVSLLISSLKSDFRTLEKKWTREIKVAQKQNMKRKRKAGNRAPSGFVKTNKNF